MIRNSNSTLTGGPLLPTSGTQPADLDLDLVLQALVSGVCGLPDSMVRLRWQPVPPPQPGVQEDWCAIGVTDQAADTNPVLDHESFVRHETITVLASFYGPNAVANAALLRDGLTVAQNNEALLPHGMRFVSSDRITRVPSLTNLSWINRADLPLTLRRRIARTYPILNVLSAPGVVETDAGATPFIAEP